MRTAVCNVFVLVMLMSLTTNSHAKKKNHHAHSHGVGTLGLVLEDSVLSVELSIPAHDLVGFENKPQNESQKAKIKEAREKLAAESNVIVIPKSAGCVLKEHELSGPVFNADTKPKTDPHSDVHASWEFHCADSSKLVDLGVELFVHFKSIHKLSVTTVNSKKQGSYQLTSKNKVIPTL